VSLGKEASLLSVPSKTYNLLSVGAPLLCIASQESELAELVSRYQLGECFEVSNIDGIVHFVEDLAIDQNAYDRMRSSALLASQEFGPENAIKLVSK
jgi:hypothetical protein